MNILVTGGAGFIGSTVVDEYIRLGHRVFVVDDESTGCKRNVHPKADYKKLDICHRPSLVRFLKNKKIDVLNHHAAQIDVRRSVSDPQYDARINIMGLLNLLEIAREKKVKKVLFSASGGTAYGDCQKAAKEGDRECPLSPYGVSKLASEKYIETYSSLYGMKYTIFRYGNVYGPRQDPHGEAGVVAIFSKNLIKRKRSKIYGSGKQTRDFVFVEDVARANSLALGRGHNGIFNIGTGIETSVYGLYQRMARIVGYSESPIYQKARSGELKRSFVSIVKAKQKLNWAPRVKLNEGLKKTIQYFSTSSSKGHFN
ncbi:hypothetical protein BVX98_04105 [bacterium F11]|nr:hypothetical protein BVX98_04105 [bacterium F11]